MAKKTEKRSRKKEPTVPELVVQIRRSFSRWKHIKAHGTTDPFWPDGTNMNLVRNHIIHDQTRLRELCNQEPLNGCPREACLKPPRGYSERYMAPGSKAAKHAHPPVKRRPKRKR